MDRGSFWSSGGSDGSPDVLGTWRCLGGLAGERDRYPAVTASASHLDVGLGRVGRTCNSADADVGGWVGGPVLWISLLLPPSRLALSACGDLFTHTLTLSYLELPLSCSKLSPHAKM